MVVGTYVKVLVGFMVVPFDKLRVESGEWAALSGCIVTLNSPFSTLNLLTTLNLLSSQLREITACAFNSSKEAVALISDEITLVR